MSDTLPDATLAIYFRLGSALGSTLACGSHHSRECEKTITRTITQQGQHRLKVSSLFSSVLPSWIVNLGLVRLLWVQGAFQVKMPTGNLEIPTSGLIWNAPLNRSGGLSPLEVGKKSVKKARVSTMKGETTMRPHVGSNTRLFPPFAFFFSKLCRKLWQRRLRTYTDSTCHSNSICTYCLEVKAYRVNVYSQSFYWFSNGSSTSKRCVLTLIISLHINVPSSK